MYSNIQASFPVEGADVIFGGDREASWCHPVPPPIHVFVSTQMAICTRLMKHQQLCAECNSACVYLYLSQMQSKCDVTTGIWTLPVYSHQHS